MSKRTIGQTVRRWWWAIAVILLLGGYWLLPISGHVIVLWNDRPRAFLWPQMQVVPASPKPGQEATLWVADVEPWVHVLLTVDGTAIAPKAWPSDASKKLTWKWTFTVPEQGAADLVFYHSCHTGCQERGRLVLDARTEATPLPVAHTPTKLGVVFADPDRDWHGRSGWDVELSYALLADEPFWGIDDLAERVHDATARGLRVLVRVDYAQGQSIPPEGDHLALTEYLAYLERLARDDRLHDVYGYLLGSGFNSLDSNTLDPEHPVTPAWYARIFNGYGEPALHGDHAVQVMRAQDPNVRLFVGPVRPWTGDQAGKGTHTPNVPWLDYMDTLVGYLDESARAKASAGIPLSAPDGFALHVPGRPGAPELMGQPRAQEPHLDLRRSEWDGAQAGFRVYQDWLAIVNAYPTTQGLPVYVTSTNTSVPGENIPPAQSYPEGWLAAALAEVAPVPQIHALCWFLDDDRSGDARWDWYSLSQGSGRLAYAAEEFDLLLLE